MDKLYASTDNFILGMVSGTSAVTIYSLSSQLTNYYSMMSTSINGLFFPKLSGMEMEDNHVKKMSILFNRVGRIQFFILFFVLSGFVIFGNYFIFLWVGDGFTDVYYICIILMIPSIIPLSQNIGIQILQAKNMHKFRSIVYLCIAVVNVVISIPLARIWNGIGAAIGTAIATVAGQIITMNWYYYKKVGINIKKYWINIGSISLKYIPVFCLGVILAVIIPGKSWMILCVEIFIYMIAYLAYTWKIQLDISEKKLIDEVGEKLKRR